MGFTAGEYVIQRPATFSPNVVYQGLEGKGNTLFDTRRNILGNQMEFIDSAGSTLGSMHKKMLSLTPYFELYDGNKNTIGKAIKKMHILPNFKHDYTLEDPSGKPLALAGGDIFGYNYAIKGADGSSEIATISRASPFNASNTDSLGQIFGSLVAAQMGSYRLNIIDKSFNKLMLIEFTVAVDHIANLQQNRGVRLGPGMGPSALGGGGFSIKF